VVAPHFPMFVLFLFLFFFFFSFLYIYFFIVSVIVNKDGKRVEHGRVMRV
jgi:hypothetical protein